MRDADLNRWVEQELGDLHIPEFFPPGYSESECNRIVPPLEQHAILDAVWHAHSGRYADAEISRARGGYGYEARESDRAIRGLVL